VTVSIRAIGASRTAPHDIEALSGSLSAERLAALKRGGITSFQACGDDVFEMAAAAALDAVARAGIPPDDVDALIVVSESLWEAPDAPGRAPHLVFRDRMLRRLVIDAGFRNAAATLQWAGACGNFAPGLRAARALVSDGASRNVILVLADRLNPATPRLVENGGAVLSDLAAAVLLDDRPASLELVRVVLHPSQGVLAPRTEANFVLQARELQKALRGLDGRLAAELGCRLAAFDRVIVETFADEMIQFACEVLQLPRDRVLTPGRGAHGHAFSADLPLSLRCAAVQRDIQPGDFVGCLSISSWMLSLCAVQVGPLCTG